MKEILASCSLSWIELLDCAVHILPTIFNCLLRFKIGFIIQYDSVSLRAVIDWCMPNITCCSSAIPRIAEIYLKGQENRGLPKHRAPILSSSAAQKKYVMGSKVMDRLYSSGFNLFEYGMLVCSFFFV